MRSFVFFILLSMQLVFVDVSLAVEPLGRLFSTPEERNHLDYLREEKKNQPIEVETVVQETVIERMPVVLPSAINLQGYVKRNDGKKGTVWVNGDALQEHTGNQEVQIGKLPSNSNRIPIRIPANGRRLTLKAGQVYEPETGKVREARAHGAQGYGGTIGDENYP